MRLGTRKDDANSCSGSETGDPCTQMQRKVQSAPQSPAEYVSSPPKPVSPFGSSLSPFPQSRRSCLNMLNQCWEHWTKVPTNKVHPQNTRRSKVLLCVVCVPRVYVCAAAWTNGDGRVCLSGWYSSCRIICVTHGMTHVLHCGFGALLRLKGAGRWLCFGLFFPYRTGACGLPFTAEPGDGAPCGRAVHSDSKCLLVRTCMCGCTAPRPATRRAGRCIAPPRPLRLVSPTTAQRVISPSPSRRCPTGFTAHHGPDLESQAQAQAKPMCWSPIATAGSETAVRPRQYVVPQGWFPTGLSNAPCGSDTGCTVGMPG